jgi:hypothetical protein
MSMMKIVVLAFASLLLGGCIAAGPSVAPFYVMKAVEPDPKFVGVWESVEEEAGAKPLPATFTVTESKRFGYDVHANMKEETPDGERIPNMFATVFRVGQHRYVDLTLGLDDMEKVNKSYAPFILSTHYLFKIEIEADEVRFLGPKLELNPFAKPDEKKKRYEFPGIDVLEGHEELLKESDKKMIATTGFQSRVVTASSPNLQRAIVEAEAAGEFSEVLVRLKRVKADAAKPAKDAEPVAPK